MKKKIVGCTILLVVVFQLTSWSPMVTAQFDVNGRVINDDGTILSDVLIYVYTSGAGGGSLVTISSVDTWGYFGIFLGAGSYDLVFKKTGYVPYTTTISGSDTWINIGEVQMTTALQLSTTATASSRVITPGTSLVLPFTLQNAGEEEEECQFNITSSEDWDMKITDNTSELTGLRIPSGVTASLNLEIDVPLNAADETSLRVTISGSTTLEWPLTIIVKNEEASLLGCEFPRKSGSLGSVVTFPVQIQNPFDVRVPFSLEMLSVPALWEVQIKNLNHELINMVLLEPNQSINLLIEMEVPEPINEGLYGFTMTATSPYLSDTLRLEVEVAESFDAAEIQAKYPSQSIPLGSTASYLLTIENPSQTAELFDLSAPEIPEGWQIVFKANEQQEIGAVLIAANGEEIITAEVTPALTSAPGEYLLPIEATSKSVQGSITLKAIVSGSYAVDVDISALFMDIDAGHTDTVTVTVTNTGYSPITNVEVLITSTPTDWTVDPSPLKHPTLNPNESVDFQIAIQVPAEVARGDYLVNFRPSIDQISASELEEQNIRVTANPETAMGIYGLALAMVALAAVFLVLMKFRRR